MNYQEIPIPVSYDSHVVASFIRLSATLIGQEADQAFHSVEPGAVEQKSAFASHGDEPRVLQLFQVERQCGSGYAELVRDHAGRESLGPALDQQSKYGETGL